MLASVSDPKDGWLKDFARPEATQGAWLQLAALLLLAMVPTAARAATLQAAATINIVKPVTIRKLTDLNFGTVVMPLSATAGTVRISQAGILTCPSQFTCSGATAAASYNVHGSNKLVVVITARPSQLTNNSNGAAPTLSFTPDAPATLILTSSGAPGDNFNVGGSVAIPATTAPGVYTGTIDVSVDYQ